MTKEKKHSLNGIGSTETPTQFPKEGKTMKRIIARQNLMSGLVVFGVLVALVVGASGAVFGQPDLTAVPNGSNLQSPFWVKAMVKNLGIATPFSNVLVRMDLYLAKCGVSGIAETKTISKVKKVKKSQLDAGESVIVMFGPYFIGAPGVWLVSGLFVTVDPSNTIAEGAPGFEDNNKYGFLTFINCGSPDSFQNSETDSQPLISTSLHEHATQSFVTTQLQLFNAASHKVLELTEISEKFESLAAQAQDRLANGVYLYVATLNDSQGKVSQKVGKIAVVRGKVNPISFNQASIIPTAPGPLPIKPQRITCGGLKPTIIGTSGPDSIIGTEGKDVIVGLGGNDWIHGLGGDDLICGGSGNDLIVGGAGNDTILGGTDQDTIEGSEGDDNLHGNDGVDQMTGGVGNDILRGGAGDDLLLGDAGYDYLNGGPGKDYLDGGNDLDTCVYGEQTFNCP